MFYNDTSCLRRWCKDVLKIVSKSWHFPQRLMVNISDLPWLPYIGIFLLSLLLAKAVLMGELHPFGISFLAAICVNRINFRKVSLAGAVLGIIFAVEGINVLWYLVSIGIIYFVLRPKYTKDSHWLLVPVLVSAVQLLTRGIGTFLSGNTLYSWVGVIFEAFFVGILTLVSIFGIRGFTKVIKGQGLTAEERTSLGLLLVGSLVGLSEVSLLSIDLQSVASRCVILWGAFLAGPGGGAAAGAAVGLVPSIEGSLITGPIAFYTLAGLLGGIFSSFKKIGVIVGFALANLLMALFYPEQALIIDCFKETFVAIVIFFILKIPSTVKLEANNTISEHIKKRENKSYIAQRLEKVGQVFHDLENIVPVQQEEKKDNGELNDLFNRVASRVCKGCSLHKVCWEQDFYKTYRSLVEACAKSGSLGCVSEKDLSSDLRRRCMRIRELSSTLNSQLEALNMNNIYDKKINECCKLVKYQLNGLADIVAEISCDLQNEINTDSSMEEYLRQELERKGIKVNDVGVLELPDGEKEIVIRQVGCNDNNWCKSMVAPNISQIMEKTYVLKNKNCPDKMSGEHCVYNLTPINLYKVTSGKAQCSKGDVSVSGDVCAAFSLPDHRFVLLISDGMGTGEKAFQESATASKLLEKLLLAGFSIDKAIKIINSILVVRSNQERFATLDVVIINQVSGQAEFVKIGGAPSLVYANEKIRMIKASAPPAGILENVDVEIIRHAVSSEDIIIMMSDGAWEALYNAEGPQGWLEDVLSKINLANPQQVANYLLLLAKKAAGKQVKDDMCIQVARIEYQEIA